MPGLYNSSQLQNPVFEPLTTVFLHKGLGLGAVTVGGNETNPTVRDVIPRFLEGNCEIVRDKEIIDGFR